MMKKIAYKKNPILLYDKIENLRIFRNFKDSDKNILDIIEEINKIENKKTKNGLMIKIVNKVVSYSKLYLIKHISKDIKELNLEGNYSILKYCCYSDKYTAYNKQMVENIKNDIIFLIDECKLSIMEVYEYNNNKENIFEILNNKSNTMSNLIKIDIYNFLIIDCKKYILKDFEYMLFNLNSKEVILEYQNRIMFIMCNYKQETYELIIKFLSMKKPIRNINFITKSLFGSEYIGACNLEKYDFIKKYEDIFDLMIENIYSYIDNINIINFLNFIWVLYYNKDLRKKAMILLNIVIYKYIINKIIELISKKSIEYNNIVNNFILSIDIKSVIMITNYLRLQDILL